MLTAHLGPTTRVGLDTAAWEDVPTRVVVDDRVVHLDSFPVGDDTALITRVVPPDTTPDVARDAMARAVDTDNVTQAADILVATLPEPATEREESG